MKLNKIFLVLFFAGTLTKGAELALLEQRLNEIRSEKQRLYASFARCNHAIQGVRNKQKSLDRMIETKEELLRTMRVARQNDPDERKELRQADEEVLKTEYDMWCELGQDRKEQEFLSNRFNTLSLERQRTAEAIRELEQYGAGLLPFRPRFVGAGMQSSRTLPR